MIVTIPEDVVSQKAIDLQQQLHAQIEQDIEDRMNAHRAALDIARAHGLFGPGRARNLVTVGDSWFDYPLGGPFLGIYTDIGAQLSHIMHPKPFILPLAHAGAATTDMFGVSKRRWVERALRGKQHGPFDAILFSGGGNDLCGEQFRLWLNDAPASKDTRHAINRAAFDAILGVIEAGISDLIQLRDRWAPDVPILLNAYDRAWPTGQNVCTNIGPWLKPSLVDRGWMTQTTGVDRGLSIVTAMLTEFDRLLERLATAKHVIHVKTQGTLVPPSPDKWDNELHPKRDGFEQIARKFKDVIDSLPWPDPALSVGV